MSRGVVPAPVPAPVRPLAAGTARRRSRARSVTASGTWTLLLAGAAFVLAALLGIDRLSFRGYAPTVPEALPDRGFVLRDLQGRERFRIRVFDDVPVLELLDAGGKPRVMAGTRLDGRPFIDLSDEAGEPRARLDLDKTGAGRLRLYDDRGRVRLDIH